jgi:hypothetical protein
MGSQCTKLTRCCVDSQFKAAVVEVPDVGGSNNWVFFSFGKRKFIFFMGRNFFSPQEMKIRVRLMTCLHSANSHLSS